MVTTWYLEESELNENFLAGVKRMFSKKRLSITISEEVDETDYLMSSDANRKRLLESLENIQKNQNLFSVDIDQMQINLLSENS